MRGGEERRKREGEGEGKEGEGKGGEGENDLTHPLSQILGYATVWRSAVSSLGRVWGRAPAEVQFGAFLPCDAVCTVSVIVILSVRPSVCLSVCLSHSWTVSTWFDLRS